MAILPLVRSESETENKWPRQEYLGLYQRIVYRRFRTKPKSEWMVVDLDGRGKPLATWLTS